MKKLDLIAVALFGAAAFAAPSVADAEPLGEKIERQRSEEAEFRAEARARSRAVAAEESPTLLPSPVLTVDPDGKPSGDAPETVATEVLAPLEGPLLLAFLDAPPSRFESEALDRLARWYPVEIVRVDRSTTTFGYSPNRRSKNAVAAARAASSSRSRKSSVSPPVAFAIS